MTAPDPHPGGPAPGAAGRRLWLAYWGVALALLAGAAVQTARTYRDGRASEGGDQFQPFWSDFLVAAALYEDIFIDGYRLRDFQFSAATFAFPDALLYFLVRPVAGGVGAAMLPWQALLFAAFVLSAGYALCGVAPPAARRWVWPALFVVTALFLATLSLQLLHLQSRHFLLPGCHTGAQACAFLGVGFLARYLRAGSPRGRRAYLAALAAVSALAMFSDRLYALDFPAPAFLALGLLRLAGPRGRGTPTWKGVFVPAAAVALGCWAGLAGLKFLPDPANQGDPIGGYWAGVEADGLAARASKLAATVWFEAGRGDILPLSGLLWLAACPVTLAVAAARRGVGPAGFAWYQLHGLFAFLAVTAVFLVSSAGASVLDMPGHNWGLCARYFAGPLAVALFGWALGIALLAAGRSRGLRVAALAAPVGLAACLLIASAAEPRHADRDLLAPYPRYLGALDEVCRRRGLTNGYSGYWEAKEATYYSKAGVKVRALLYLPGHADGPLLPHVWLSNAGWYFPRPGDPRPGDPPPDPPQFVLAKRPAPGGGGLPADAMKALFGAPAEEVTVGDLVILVYDRPQDAAFQTFPRRCVELGLLRGRLAP